MKFKCSVQLYNSYRDRNFTITAANREDAIDKLREKVRNANLDATGLITIYRVGQIQPPLELSISFNC